MRVTPVDLLLKNLAGEIPEGIRGFKPKAEAQAKLKELTGQDFGFDVIKWRDWLKRHPIQTKIDPNVREAVRKLLDTNSEGTDGPKRR